MLCKFLRLTHLSLEIYSIAVFPIVLEPSVSVTSPSQSNISLSFKILSKIYFFYEISSVFFDV